MKSLQPRFDEEPVPEASFYDFDDAQVSRYLDLLRYRRPRVLDGITDQRQALVRAHVLRSDGETPTLAGLLAFGTFPQYDFPQLMVPLAVFPGRDKGTVDDGIRMLDRLDLKCSLPCAKRSPTQSCTAITAFKHEVIRLESKSTPTASMPQEGLPIPRFKNTIDSFIVTLDRHGLLNTETKQWFIGIGTEKLSLWERSALALHHEGTPLTKRSLRTQLAIDSDQAEYTLVKLAQNSWLEFPR